MEEQEPIFFEGIKDCFYHVKENAETHGEKVINDCLYFGMSIYAYSGCVTKSGVHDCSKSKDLFYHFKSDIELIRFIAWLKDTDNYLMYYENVASN